jgi:hypothetical protein
MIPIAVTQMSSLIHLFIILLILLFSTVHISSITVVAAAQLDDNDTHIDTRHIIHNSLTHTENYIHSSSITYRIPIGRCHSVEDCMRDGEWIHIECIGDATCYLGITSENMPPIGFCGWKCRIDNSQNTNDTHITSTTSTITGNELLYHEGEVTNSTDHLSAIVSSSSSSSSSTPSDDNDKKELCRLCKSEIVSIANPFSRIPCCAFCHRGVDECCPHFMKRVCQYQFRHHHHHDED